MICINFNNSNKKSINKSNDNRNAVTLHTENIIKILDQEGCRQFQQALNNDYIIRPGHMEQFRRILPPNAACIQYIPAGKNIIFYLTLKDKPPIAKIIKLNDSRPILINKINDIRIEFGSNYATGRQYEYYIFFEYTKTTD